MFGNLFEDDGEESFSSTPTNGRETQRAEEAPAPRGRSNLCGIKNQGGTCYLNSLLQTLLFTPEFREELFRLAPDELGSLEDKDKPGAKVRVIPLELQRLFTRLLLVDQQSASTSDLTDSFGWNSSEGTNQHDVQELNRILFSALEHSLVGTSGSSFIHRLYHGTIVNSIECKECGNVSQRQEDFMDLTVCVCGVSSLEEALWNMFVEEELFEGNNLYRCTNCDRLVTAAKSAKLSKLPPFLTISLLRFSFDFAKCERYKETGRYSFPLTINLRPFCEQTEGEDSEYSYELFSVIIHKGGCYGGHYHAYIKDIDQLGNWEQLEEDCKIKTNKRVQHEVQTATEPKLREDDPLSVLTAIIAQEPLKSVLLDQLGQKLLDKIGSSWSKKFRKQYGPIGKFLQLHKDTFMLVSNGTRVALKRIPPTQDQSPGPKKEAASSVPADEPPEELPEPEPEPEGHHWFDVNDSTVTSIRESDMEKQFQGKESAYMLFFRKTELSRPSEARHCSQYKVPEHLIQMAQEENTKFQNMRENLETSNNTLDLRLHLGPSYRLTNGALQPLSQDPSGPTSLSFDRRKTVGELRLTIYQQQELWEGDMVLTVARSLPAGLHLYNTLPDDNISLYSAGIYTNTDLFVWNGREVCGTGVMTGSQWEPLLITVVRPCLGEDVELVKNIDRGDGGDMVENGAPELIKEARGFAGGATLGELREALGEPKESLICQEHKAKGDQAAVGEGGGASGWRIFPPDDMQRTLKELSLKDGDALLVLEPHSFDSSVFSINGDMVTVTTPSDCRWLQVELTPSPAEEKRRIKVPATGNMLLSEVKQRAVKELELQQQQQPGAEFCLRQVDCAGKLLPPVCEELSVREAGVRLMTTLLLCPGVAPKASQLFLSYCLGRAPSADMEMNILVQKTCTVKECLKMMLDKVGLEGTCWHLRRLDWCEEVGEPLMDEDSSLVELKVQSGDTLVITEGQLPPKGFLQLSVWLYTGSCREAPTLLNHTDNGLGGDDGLTSDGVVLNGRHNKVALMKMGQVEISDEVTLDDLKIHVSTLPALQDKCVPTVGFMRVWQLEGRRLSRLLKGQQQTLRKLKISTGSEICVQHLLREENLGPKEILLNSLMGVPGERSYYPSEELVWDASRDSSARSLRTCLAAHYGLSPDSLLLAKHQPDKCSWEEVSSWNQQVSSKKKKKKTESLLAAPFHLKDGDVIGVKNLGIDTNRDFCTVEDEWGQQRLRELAEQRRKGEQPAASNGDGSRKKTARKPEVGLSINVGEFK